MDHGSIRLLGPLALAQRTGPVAVPQSRKVRALLALLVLSPLPLLRARVCDLLWDAANDPRSELRWCLSKLRSVLDDATHSRIVTTGNTHIALDVGDCFVDTREVDEIAREGIAQVSTGRLTTSVDLFRGDFLEGTDVDGAELSAWINAQRDRYQSTHIAILSELARRAPRGSEENLRWLDALLHRTPFDLRAHQARRESFSSVSPSPASQLPPPPGVPRRGSVVVMPFSETDPGLSAIANGLTDDMITGLAKLRSLFVIARGTAYVLRDRGLDARDAGRVLNVDYVVSGRVWRDGDALQLVVELVDAQDATIVWTDEWNGPPGDALSLLDGICDRVVATVAEEIERAEIKRAVLKPPSSLDAWEAYHRGLWHMYKFTGSDNETAGRLFRDAIALDPMFARAHAALSFTHFQNVFLDLVPERPREVDLALETAGHSLAADGRDPAAHWAMGRALWLRGEMSESLVELERSVDLSPNFALGHYTLGFVHAQSGDPNAAIVAADYSRQLSPFDPLQFGMLGSRALAHMRLGEHEEAAVWGLRAATRPNAHAHILAIAATTLALANRKDEGRGFVARLRMSRPNYSIDDFLRAFRFTRDAEASLRSGARSIGFE